MVLGAQASHCIKIMVTLMHSVFCLITLLAQLLKIVARGLGAPFCSLGSVATLRIVSLEFLFRVAKLSVGFNSLNHLREPEQNICI